MRTLDLKTGQLSADIPHALDKCFPPWDPSKTPAALLRKAKNLPALKARTKTAHFKMADGEHYFYQAPDGKTTGHILVPRKQIEEMIGSACAEWPKTG